MYCMYSTVTFEVASTHRPSKRYRITKAFTSENLALAEHTYPVIALKSQYKHLQSLPLPHITKAQPLLLIGFDMPHLIVPLQPVHAGPPGGPVGVLTCFGWTLQGPTCIAEASHSEQQYLHTSIMQSCSAMLSICGRWTLYLTLM